MTDKFYLTEEWLRGDNAQKQWAAFVAQPGRLVLPAYGFSGIDGESKAPLLLTADGLRVSPDMLVLALSEPSRWHEVKAKARPTWRRNPPGPRWEHGFDYSLKAEYAMVEKKSGSPVFIIVQEERSPLHPDGPEPGACQSWTTEDWCRFEHDDLQGEQMWLSIRLTQVENLGCHRADWPGGKKEPHRRGRNGQGGWLWPRSAMRCVHVAELCVPERVTTAVSSKVQCEVPEQQGPRIKQSESAAVAEVGNEGGWKQRTLWGN